MQFQENKIEQNGSFSQIRIADLAKGESIVFFYKNASERVSQEYGAFQVCEGLELYPDTANGEADLIAAAVPSSFVPNTMLQNMLNQSSIVPNRAYRITKKWNKDEKFADGRKAKGHGYEVAELRLPASLIEGLNKRFAEAIVGGEEVLTPTDLTAPKKSGKTL